MQAALTMALIYDDTLQVSVVWLPPPAGILCLVGFPRLSRCLGETYEWALHFQEQGCNLATVAYFANTKKRGLFCVYCESDLVRFCIF